MTGTHAKNAKLRSERGIGFEDIASHIERSDLLDILEQPDPSGYANQLLVVVQREDYVYAVRRGRTHGVPEYHHPGSDVPSHAVDMRSSAKWPARERRRDGFLDGDKGIAASNLEEFDIGEDAAARRSGKRVPSVSFTASSSPACCNVLGLRDGAGIERVEGRQAFAELAFGDRPCQKAAVGIAAEPTAPGVDLQIRRVVREIDLPERQSGPCR